MILLNKSTTFNQALVCMMMAMSLNALGNSGVAVTPQDMSPKFAGTLFGKMPMLITCFDTFVVHLRLLITDILCVAGSRYNEFCRGIFR